MSSIHDCQKIVVNWRRLLSQNRRRTVLVITTFVLIYLVVGLLADLCLYAECYPEATVSQLFFALLTFQLFPKATAITGLIAAVSLYVTFAFSHKLMMLGTEYQEITLDTAKTLKEKMLYNVIEELKISAGLKFMPRMYIINANYMNAFASGYNEKSAMIAITRGLLYKLDRSELEAVMAHELSHIRHMDIKLTMTASVLANILLIVVDTIFFSIILRGREEEGATTRNSLFVLIFLSRYLMSFITVILLLYLSRTREYMADAGSVELMRDNEPLARALIKIQNDSIQNQEDYSHQYFHTPHEAVRHASYIFNPVITGTQFRHFLSDFFSTHPSLVKRLAAIGYRLKQK
ncbi:zinc metalloprotease HtpX [Coxiella endosymbiont of Amblyomma nuttalli]|uniref:zinc metalloprotease HtpX n=1 Tax=Coxiella endosymbiont of Amblyomma nuttalli TaxID=2749996 RepID=UPI001BADC402|nr:zinc metalloprotease HtpX [Coxiella endosymbiont of Amblyomma nuttalli]